MSECQQNKVVSHYVCFLLQYCLEEMRLATKKVIFLLFLAVVLNTLHLQQQNSPILALKAIQNTLIGQISIMRQSIEQSNVLSFGGKPIDEKIQILEHFLISQRTRLLTIIKSYHYDLNNTPWSCEAFSPIAKTHFQNSYTRLVSKYAQLNAYLKTNLSSVAAYRSTIDFSELVATYLNSQKSAYFSKGREETSKNLKISKLSNYNAGFWALGNLSSANVSEQLKRENTQLCPYYVPFADKQGKCKQCPNQRPVFILQGQSCFSCATYNRQKRLCLDQKGNILAGTILFTNYAATKGRILLQQNQNIQSFSSNTQNLPLCPINSPFFNGKQCIDCPKQLYFSPSQSVCRSCPIDFYYDSNSMNCKKVFYYSRAEFLSWATNNKSVQDILQSISLKKSQVSYRECPQKSPFSVNTECIFCQKPSHFSYDTLKCQKCPPGTILNLNVHKCIAIGNINYQTNPMNSPNLILNGKSLNQWASIYYSNLDNQSGISDCPSSSPYFDGIACIKCPKSHPYFNLQTLICQYCQGTTIYDAGQRQCVSSSQKRAVQIPTWEKMAAAIFR